MRLSSHQVMFTPENVYLKWHNFHENITTAVPTLREERDFSDVTLAYEDGQQVDTHKVFLLSSSPLFKNI